MRVVGWASRPYRGFDTYVPKLPDFECRSFSGLGEHARRRAALGLEQVHRRVADEDGRGGRNRREDQGVLGNGANL